MGGTFYGVQLCRQGDLAVLYSERDLDFCSSYPEE